MGKNGNDGDAQAAKPHSKNGAKSVKAAIWAKNKTALAKAIGVTRATINAWRKEPGFPEPKSNGRWAIAEVFIWMELNGKDKPANEEEQPSQLELKNKLLKLQAKKLAHQIAVAEKEYIPVIEAQKAIGEMIFAAKKVLLSGPASLAPQVVGVSIPEAEKLLREWLYQALTQLSNNSIAKEITKEVCHASG